jgi:hypothetical protein
MPENHTAIILSPEIIPHNVKILTFEPGRVLRIRVRMPISQRLGFLAFSLTFFLVVAQAAGSILRAVMGDYPLILLLCTAAATAFCIYVNLRGLVLTIFFIKPGYRLVSPVSFLNARGLPRAELSTTNVEGRWLCKLSLAGQVIATNISDAGAAEAEVPFRDFASVFLKLEKSQVPAEATDVEVPKSFEILNAPKSPAPKMDRVWRRPLIILVHGTWGTKSLWAFPESSQLVKVLGGPAAEKLEFEHFPWSGRNRTGDRMEAASRLRDKIQSELSQYDREIVIVAHSHGGNIAVRAFSELSEGEQATVRSVLLATPFLWSGQRFNVRDVYNVMPRFIQANLSGLCYFGFWLAANALIYLLQMRYLDEGYRLNLFQKLPEGPEPLWALPLLIGLFFGPFFLFNMLWKRGMQWFDTLHDVNTSVEQRETFRDPSRFLVVAYNQDEAFQALSVVMNLLGLVHQIVFLIVLTVARLATRVRLFEFLWQAPWVIFEVLMLISAIAFSVAMVLNALAPFWPSLEAVLQLGGSAEKYLFGVLNADVGFIFFFMFGIGIVAVVTIFSMLLMGTIRIGILSIIGVMDQIRNKDSFLDASVGTVAISVVPEGQATSLLLPGRALFNHVKIYDDTRVIDRIAEFILKPHLVQMR